MEAVNPATVVEAIKSPSPAIGFLYQDSKIRAAAILTLLVTDLVKFFNVGKNMTDHQVAQTVTLILEDEGLRSLKPDDFKLCFTRIKKGFYGKSYDRMDGQIILECLTLYLHERVLECEQMSFARHQEIKAKKKLEVSREGLLRLAQTLKEAIKDIPPHEPEKKVVKLLPKIEKSPRDLFIQECMREFDRICDKAPSKDSAGKIIPGRFIDYEITDVLKENNGDEVQLTHVRPIDVTEYITIKLTHYDKQT